MRYFDLHSDTVTTAMARGKGFYDENLHINLLCSNLPHRWEQCFALWQDDTLKGDAAFKKCKAQLDYFKKELLSLEKQKDNFKFHLTIENASAIGDDRDNIYFFKDEKVRMITLTWNGENALGYGALSEERGLKAFGKSCIREMENAGIIVDVSHLNKTGFCDVLKIATKPFVASHSNCSAVYRHKRNLENWQLQQIIASGGLIGICFYDAFLGEGKVDTFKKIYENIYCILSMGGEKNICFGSDFDGARLNPMINSIEKVRDLYTYLKGTDIPETTLKNIFYNNAKEFFEAQMA